MTLEDPTDLEIIVVDQNDNRPLFRQDVFTGHVVEGAEPGGSSRGGCSCGDKLAPVLIPTGMLLLPQGLA